MAKNKYKKVKKMYVKIGMMSQKSDDAIIYKGFTMSQGEDNHLKVTKNKA